MASIITATNSSGLTTSADNSGVLQLASGTGNLVTVPSVTGTAMVSGNMPAFSAYLTSNQSVTVGTWTKVTQDTEEFDTNNNFASSRFTPTVAGYYQINGIILFNAGTNISRSVVALYKNGSNFKQGGYSYVNNTVGPQSGSVSAVVYMNGSSDYIELYGYVDGGGTLLFLNTQTWLNGSLVRAA